MRLQFVLSEIGIGLRRNLAITLSVVLVTLVSLTFVGLALVFQSQVDLMKGYWYDRVQVSIFLCAKDSVAETCPAGEVTQAQKDEIRADLESPALAPYVDTVYYESKAEAYDRFTEQFSDSAIVENVTQDQMPESFRVKLVDPEEYQVISEFFAGRPGVEQVEDQRELLDTFFAVLNVLTIVALGFALVMVVAAALLIATTIRLSAFNRRREIGIMRMVGASSPFIQLPFLLEGVIAACLGALLASVVMWALLEHGVGWLSENLTIFTYVGTSELWTVVPVLFGIAVVLAGVSSLVTTSRYLRV
ncbi:permease-like cell division protein FtsX [Thalassiella azotivora]